MPGKEDFLSRFPSWHDLFCSEEVVCILKGDRESLSSEAEGVEMVAWVGIGEQGPD